MTSFPASGTGQIDKIKNHNTLLSMPSQALAKPCQGRGQCEGLADLRYETPLPAVYPKSAVSAVDTAMSARTLQCPPWMLQCPRFFAKF